MTHSNVRRIVTSATLTLLSGGILCLADGSNKLVGSEGGTASFHSGTNVPGIEVKGTSNALKAHAEVQKNGNQLVLQKVEGFLPVKTLATGMKMRDEHMRKYIFATPDGKEPDLFFNAESASCPAAGQGQEFSCQMSGSLSIRGVSRPFAINLKVKESGSASTFRVAGDGVVKLSDYGIPQPVQFGVKSADQVEIHLDFTGKEKSSGKGDSGGGQ